MAFRRFAAWFACTLLAGCGSSAGLTEDKAPTEPARADGGADERRDAGVGTEPGSSDAASPAKDAAFTHAAVCTANWLGQDATKLFAFAVEMRNEPKHPNGEKVISASFTPLRTAAKTLDAAATSGTTFGFSDAGWPEENLDAGLGDLTIPADSNPEKETLTFYQGAANLHDASVDKPFCGLIRAQSTLPKKETGPEWAHEAALRCLFIPTAKGGALPTPTFADFEHAPCAAWPYPW